MKRKDYELIAQVFADAYETEGTPLGRNAIRSTARLMADQLSSNDRQFDITQFMRATKIERP